MKRIGIRATLGTMVALIAPGVVIPIAMINAQENEKQGSQQNQQPSKQSSSEQSRQSGKQKPNDRDELRLNYDDDKSRLSIDVDEEIDFQNRSNRRDVLRDGQFELRYDTDKNDLRTSGEGTIDMDRAASQMGSWWQSWWDDERQARRDRADGASVGAAEFIRQYDDNNDQLLSNRELPPRMRSDFQQIDRNDDGVLSRLELSRYGELAYDKRNRSSQNQQADNVARNGDNDRTWSQWWSSWWSDDQSGGSQQEVAISGSKRLLQTYDRNNDGFLTKSELPGRMQDDFEFLDRNNDGYISRTEVQQYGYALRTQRITNGYGGRAYAASGTGNANSSREQSNNRSQANGNDDDQTWSQWWSSWWSDDNGDQSRQAIAVNGTRQFMRQHDSNGDDVIVRSEMPRGMYDEFASIDLNNDRRLTREEISQYATQTGEQFTRSSRRQGSTTAQQRSTDDSDPMSTAYVWVIDVNRGNLRREELQKAYAVLRDIDANSDGNISQNELEKRREQAVVEWCENCFDKLDENGDDRLSRSEAAESMFARIFDKCDQNDDDRLSKSEAKQGVQKELESQSASRTQSGQGSRR